MPRCSGYRYIGPALFYRAWTNLPIRGECAALKMKPRAQLSCGQVRQIGFDVMGIEHASVEEAIRSQCQRGFV